LSFSLSILDRYLIKELYKTFFAVASVLLLIIFANNFVQSLEKIVGGYFNTSSLWKLMGLQFLEMMGFLIPPSFFFAILISLGRLYRDSEMIAMQSSGVGPFPIYRAYIIASIPIIVLTTLLVMYTLPWAKYSLDQLEANKDRENTEFTVIETGKFQELQKGETIFFAGSEGLKTGEIKDIFIQNRRNGSLGIISAKEGYQYTDDKTGDQYLVLKKGFRYTGEPGTNSYTVSEFYEYGIHIRQTQEKHTSFSFKSMPVALLISDSTLAAKVEWQFRLSIPLAILALTFLGIPLSRSLPRQGIYGRLFLAFIVYFSFMNLHKLAHKWMEQGESAVWLGMWWVPFIAILIALLIEVRDRYDYLINWKSFTKMVKRV